VKSAIVAGTVEKSPVKSRLAIDKAIAALCAGDQLEAEQTLRQYLLEVPDNADALTKLAEIVNVDGRMEEAAVLLRRAVTSDPCAPRHLALARQLFAYAGPAVALAHFERFPEITRSTFELAAFEAVLLGMLGKHDLQLESYATLIAERPRDPVLWINKANVLKAIGRVDDAVAALRRAIDLDRHCGEAYWNLANLKSWRFTERDVAAIRNALRGKLTDEDKLHFEFALGRALEQREAYAESFAHYHAGNRIRSQRLQAREMQVTGFVDEIVATFSDDLFNRLAHSGCSAVDPIFVVGLHRSGSTLIEQILASHPMIEGAGELPVMQQIFARIARDAVKRGGSPFEVLSRWNPSDFEEIGAEYLDRTRPFRSTDCPRFVDKLPANWLNVGLIRLALPNAKIVDARRNPLACGFSNFKQHYATGVHYAYSLESIGRFYRDYLRLMDHFDRVQPNAIYHLVNEDLIEKFEPAVRRLLEYVDVPFDEACLSFHDNQRAVNTPSAQQVRQALNREGIDAWRAYEPWLGPLKEELGSVLNSWLP